MLFDGALGSRGAALLKPYSDAPETSGLLREKPEDIRPMFEEALRRGIQVETHALGDRANRLILDLYAQALKGVPADERKIREPRWRIEHAQIVDPVDIPRFAKLGVIPSMQPFHVIDDGRWAEGRIGPARCASSYANRSLLDAGAKLAFGSDWSVAPLSPILGIDAAVNRRTLDGKHPGGWFPEQKISMSEAFEAYTL